MPLTHIPKSTFTFLRKIQKNNNREWFALHKKEFKKEEQLVKEFFENLMLEMSQHDKLDSMKMFRIYRDVRFSKDKTPYNSHMSCSFSRATEALRGGYYIYLKPGNQSIVGGGFWQPNKEDLFRIRKEFELNDKPIRKIMNSSKFINYFGGEFTMAEELKTAPKGFDKEHKAIDLIRKKGWVVKRTFTDKEVHDDSFLNEVNNSFMAMRPFFDYMSELLTTNLDGESLI